MYIAYMDESGDDGFPSYSAPLFVLTSVYLKHENWHEIYSQNRAFRNSLRTKYGFPLKFELHTRSLLLNKKPYCSLRLPEDIRVAIIEEYCSIISSLPIKIINVVINKTIIKSPSYGVLDKSLAYTIQRIENDLRKLDFPESFMLLADPGRINKMRSITRKIQKINYIPSKYGNYSYKKEIQLLIEDPLPKESDQSYFIQMADCISYLVFLYMIENLAIDERPNRLPFIMDKQKVFSLLTSVKPVLNIFASRSDPFGIVCYPLK